MFRVKNTECKKSKREEYRKCIESSVAITYCAVPLGGISGILSGTTVSRRVAVADLV